MGGKNRKRSPSQKKLPVVRIRFFHSKTLTDEQQTELAENYRRRFSGLQYSYEYLPDVFLEERDLGRYFQPGERTHVIVVCYRSNMEDLYGVTRIKQFLAQMRKPDRPHMLSMRVTPPNNNFVNSIEQEFEPNSHEVPIKFLTDNPRSTIMH